MVSSIETLNKKFQLGEFTEICKLAIYESITPQVNPTESLIVAGAFFQLNKYQECTEWCEHLYPVMASKPEFLSMYGAALRRIGRQNDAQKIFLEGIQGLNSSKELLNNYANLLIDMERFSEARQILSNLVGENPTYNDARENLNRLNYIESSLIRENNNQSNKSTNQSASKEEVVNFADPLLDAFTQQEVELSVKNKKFKSFTNSEKEFISKLPQIDTSKTLNELIILARELVMKTPDQCLSICEHLYRELPMQEIVYEIAGQAYVNLKRFNDAERCWLIALAMGSADITILLNLANVAHLRGDILLSSYWLEQVARKEPNHPKLEEIKKALGSKVIDKKEMHPFQIHI